MFYVKMLETIKKVTGAVHVHVFHHQLRDARDNADGDGLNTSVQPYVAAVHSNSSRYAAEEVFLRFAGNKVDAKFCKGRFVYINAWRNITTDPIENNHLAVYDETSLVSLDDYLASDLFLPGARSMQYRLSDYNVAKSRWYYFPKIQMDVVLQFEQFDSDTALPRRMTCHTTFVDPTVRPDALEKQSIECSVFQLFLDFEPNTCPALPSVAVAKEVALYDERGAWDLWLVRELSEWMRNDVYSEVLVRRMTVNLGMKFAEMACRDPATTLAVVHLTVLRTQRGEWKIRGISLPFGRLSLNSLSVCTIPVRREPNLHVDLTAICHRHDYDLMWFGHRDTSVYGFAWAIGEPIGLNCEYRKYLRTIAGIRMSRYPYRSVSERQTMPQN